MKDKKKIQAALKKYLPEGYEVGIAEKIFSHPVKFKITKPRKTKLGDFRPGTKDRPHQITINGDLNKYQFLITTLHEFAHLKTFLDHGNSVKPHGIEWKKNFNALLEPIKRDTNIPQELRKALNKNDTKIKASSCTDPELFRVLKKFDEAKDQPIHLEDIGNNELFEFRTRVFKRGILKRTRYLCQEVNTKKQYLINRLAEVRPIDELK
jgi:hypothetical protein